VKTKQNEAKTFYILQDRSETNVFVSDWEEEKRRKKKKLRFCLDRSEEKRMYLFLNYRRFAIATNDLQFGSCWAKRRNRKEFCHADEKANSD
jgi:hypothetical protein